MRRPLVAAAFLVLTPTPAAAAPAPSLAASATSGPAPLLVRFQASAAAVDPAPAVVSYAWSFGDGAEAEGASVSHRFVEPGRYTVRLTVTDSLGGSEEASLDVRAQALRLALTPSTVVFGSRTLAHGALVPAEPAARVLLERRSGDAWRLVSTARTDSAGRFGSRLLPGRSGAWRARLAGSPVRSEPLLLKVAPQVRVEAGVGVAFLGAPLVVLATPRALARRARVTVLRAGRTVAQKTVPVGSRVSVPTPGVGSFALRIEVGGRTVRSSVSAGARTLSYGSTGRDVLALRNRLAHLRVHVPAPSTRFGSELYDAVIAFQKARRLPRTGAVTAEAWRALSAEWIPRPRYRGPGEHIEVVKGRQILLVVREGETVAILPVSSGAGGITPVGSFRIKWKALATTTWLGPAILYRTMTFAGNVAIHGFSSVPSYPASHGCVRIPIWAADWLYSRSSVGEPVYVYE